MSTPSGVYPFATPDGQAIPLDIIKGTAAIVLPFTRGVISTCTLPEYAVVGVLLSKKACLIQFGGGPLTTLPGDGDVVTNGVIVPDNGILTVALEPGQLHVMGLENTGVLYIQLIEQWAAIGLRTQFARI